jgi:hypothetical protein
MLYVFDDDGYNAIYYVNVNFMNIDDDGYNVIYYVNVNFMNV